MHAEWTKLGPLRARWAQPETAPGCPVMLLHGMGGGAWVWERMQAWLAEHGRASFALELPGHGEDAAAGVDDYGLEFYAGLAGEALAQMPEAFFAGHSMGGLIAQLLAARQPAAGYVFWSSAPPWHMLRPAYGRMWRAAAARPGWLLRGMLGRPILWPAEMQAALPDAQLSPAQRAWVRQRTVAESGRAVRQMSLGAGLARTALQAPCAVLAAAADRLLPLGEQQRLAGYYGCDLQILPGGHMLPLEDAGEAAAAWLDGWCREQE